MDGEAIEHYLSDRSRHGPAPAGAFSGSAGGAPCGDLVRVSIALAKGRIAAVSFGAEGCASARAAAAALAEEIEGAALLEAALIGPDDVAGLLGGLGLEGRHAADLAADALHRALGAAAASGEVLATAPSAGERVLVALSGGVDSAVAALLERERGAEVVAVTLKLWADRRTDQAKSCCSPLAVIGARRVAHSLGIPHLTLDLESAFRERVVGAFVAGYRAGETPNPCVLCNGDLRIDAMIALADRLGCDGARHRSLRADRRRRRRTAARGRRRPGQGPDLHARRARDRLASPAALPARRAAKGGGPRARRRRRARGRRQGREPGPLLSRRRGQALLSRAPGRPRASAPERFATAPATGSASIAATTCSPSASVAASASPRPEPLYVLETDAESNTVVARRARGAGAPNRGAARRDPAPKRRPGRRGPPPLPLALTSLRASRGRRRRSRGARAAPRPSPPTASPPARPPACSPATS